MVESNFFRVYLRKNGKNLHFESEVKKIIAKKFQHFLFTNQFERFETFFTIHF